MFLLRPVGAILDNMFHTWFIAAGLMDVELLCLNPEFLHFSAGLIFDGESLHLTMRGLRRGVIKHEIYIHYQWGGR